MKLFFGIAALVFVASSAIAAPRPAVHDFHQKLLADQVVSEDKLPLPVPGWEWRHMSLKGDSRILYFQMPATAEARERLVNEQFDQACRAPGVVCLREPHP